METTLHNGYRHSDIASANAPSFPVTASLASTAVASGRAGDEQVSSSYQAASEQVPLEGSTGNLVGAVPLNVLQSEPEYTGGMFASPLAPYPGWDPGAPAEAVEEDVGQTSTDINGKGAGDSAQPKPGVAGLATGSSTEEWAAPAYNAAHVAPDYPLSE